jgi:hypothetical protein
MSITDLINKKAIIFPEEIDTSGTIKYDFTKLNNYNELSNIFNSSKIDLNNIDCLVAFNTLSNSGLVSSIAKEYNKDLLLINPETGFPAFGSRKVNYKLKYALWIDTLSFDREIFAGLQKLAKRGLRISHIYSLIDTHENVRLYLSEVFPNAIINPVYELYDLMAIYESKNLLTGFLIEKCKFNADRNRKMTHAYVETYIKHSNGTYDYIKNPIKWYVDNYLEFNNLTKNGSLDMNTKQLILQYTSGELKWSNIYKDIDLYGSHINKLIIDLDIIEDINNEELLELQNKYNFNVFEYSPYNKLLNTRYLELNKMNINELNYLTTDYDGVVFSLDLSMLKNDDYYNDLTTLLSSISKKVLLYPLVSNVNDIELLRDIILYSNEYSSSRIQGVIFDYSQVKNLVFDKKMSLHLLVPLILNVSELTNDIPKYFVDNGYQSLLTSLHTIPLELRHMNWINGYSSFMLNKFSRVDKYLNELDDDIVKNRITKYVSSHKFALDTNIGSNNDNDNSENSVSRNNNSLISYISPFAWYKYLMS